MTPSSDNPVDQREIAGEAEATRGETGSGEGEVRGEADHAGESGAAPQQTDGANAESAAMEVPVGERPRRRRRRRRRPLGPTMPDAAASPVQDGADPAAAETIAAAAAEPGATAASEPNAGAAQSAPGAAETRPPRRPRRRRRRPRPEGARPEASGDGASGSAPSATQPAEAGEARETARPDQPPRPPRSRPYRSRRDGERRPEAAGARDRAGPAAARREGVPGRRRSAADGRAEQGRRDKGPRGRRDGRPSRDREAPRKPPERKLYAFDSVVDRGFEDVANEGEDGGTRRVHWTIVKRTVADLTSRKPVSAVYVLQRDDTETEFPNLGAARGAVNKTILHPEKLTRSKAEHVAAKK